jgi:putative spermidine/putrescine transport system permease protein
LWFLVIYLSSLILMLVTSFWSVNGFTQEIDRHLTGANFAQISSGAYVTIIWRTVLLAALVTLTDAIVAFPFAYVMARVATQRTQRILRGSFAVMGQLPGQGLRLDFDPREGRRAQLDVLKTGTA